MKLKAIILDAGHGGMIGGEYQTAGKRSPIWSDGSQYFEGVGNRMIQKKIAKMLVGTDVSVYYSSDSEKDVSLAERIKEINKIATRVGRKDCLLISIHSNGFSKESAHGWSCYTTKGKTASDQYATELYNQAKKIFPDERMRTEKLDGDPDIESNFYVLRKSICAAILSENFFHTNERECKEFLLSETGREKIALAHVEMIKHFL